MAFLWVFEPELDTLHPAERLDNKDCKSMRDRSVFTRRFNNRHGRRPSQQGVEPISSNYRLERARSALWDRDSALNFQNLLFMTTTGTVKKAVEHKQ